MIAAQAPRAGVRKSPREETALGGTCDEGTPMTTYMKFIRPFALGLGCMSLAIGHAAAQSQDRAFQFGLIGDMPYTTVQQQEYQHVLAALNKANLAFAVHIGDFQNDPRGYYPNPAVG